MRDDLEYVPAVGKRLAVDRHKVLANGGPQRLEGRFADFLIKHVINELVAIPVFGRPLEGGGASLKDAPRRYPGSRQAKGRGVHTRQLDIRIDLYRWICHQPDVGRQNGQRQYLRRDITRNERDVYL